MDYVEQVSAEAAARLATEHSSHFASIVAMHFNLFCASLAVTHTVLNAVFTNLGDRTLLASLLHSPSGKSPYTLHFRVRSYPRDHHALEDHKIRCVVCVNVCVCVCACVYVCACMCAHACMCVCNCVCVCMCVCSSVRTVKMRNHSKTTDQILNSCSVLCRHMLFLQVKEDLQQSR